MVIETPSAASSLMFPDDFFCVAFGELEGGGMSAFAYKNCSLSRARPKKQFEVFISKRLKLNIKFMAI